MEDLSLEVWWCLGIVINLVAGWCQGTPQNQVLVILNDITNLLSSPWGAGQGVVVGLIPAFVRPL